MRAHVVARCLIEGHAAVGRGRGGRVGRDRDVARCGHVGGDGSVDRGGRVGGGVGVRGDDRDVGRGRGHVGSDGRLGVVEGSVDARVAAGVRACATACGGEDRDEQRDPERGPRHGDASFKTW